MTELEIGGRPLTGPDLRRVLAGKLRLALAPAARKAITDSHQALLALAAGDQLIYGVTTGFGALSGRAIPEKDRARLQLNLLQSHAAGVGAPLPDAIVRLVLVLKIQSLARGHSGVGMALVEALIALVNADALPVVPEKGSVGASGDLAPLAHLSLPLIGAGRVRLRGEELPGADALARIGLAPPPLGPKAGLALLNGTQVSTALALDGLFRGQDCLAAALVAGAMSTDAARGSDTPFDARIHRARGQKGQIDVAAALRALMADSEIRKSHLTGDHRVQDPYCLRCQPQVMGAALDQLRHAAGILLIEANAVTDNPLLFGDEVLTGGNFHAEPVALAADQLAIALAEVAALSERRIAMLIDQDFSGLPPFLAPDPGLNSGFMMAQVTAAALASEIKHLAHPASIDSLPTSANQEDHVSMATFAARRLRPLTENLCAIIAIELLAAAQGVDFHRPLKSSAPLEAAHAAIRARAPRLAEDREFAPDIAAISELVAAGQFGQDGAELF